MVGLPEAHNAIVGLSDLALTETHSVAVPFALCSGEDEVLDDCRSGELWVQHNTSDNH
jgi:hypothetical protein